MKVSQLTLVSASLIIFLFLSPHLAQAALTDGLVGHWTLDGKDVSWATGTVTDRSGQGNNGKVVSMSTTTATVAGKTGQGLFFNGSTNYITVPDNDTFTITGARTFSLWMKTASTTGFRAINKSTGPILNTSEWALGTSGGGLYYAIFYDSGATANNCSVGSTVSASADVNTWTHLIVTYSGSGGCSGIKLYRNAVDVTGSISNSGTGFSSFSNTSAPVTFGVVHKGDPVYEAWAKGTMDDVRIYNRALSAQEIQQLYAQGATKMGVSPSPSSGQQGLGAGLVGYWTMDGKDVNWATNTITDASGNGNTGTTTNTFSTTTSPVAGKIGQALDFRSTSVIGIPNSSSLQVGNVFTLSAWVKMDSLTARQSIFSTRSNADAGGWNIEVGPAGIDGVGDKRVPNSVAVATPGLFNAVSDNVLATSTWAHITYVRNGDSVGTQKIYINGISRTLSTDNPQAITNNTAIKLVGATTYPGNFDGIIDDVRLYNRALSAQEVRQLYALGGSKVAVSPTVAPLTTGLVGHWTLDGKDVSWATGTVTDKSGQGNSGKVVSMSTTTSPVAGKIGQGLKFDGTTSYVSVEDSSSLGITSTLTVSAWVRPTSIPANIAIVNKQWCSGNQYSWGLLVLSGGQLYLDWDDDGSCVGVAGTLTSNAAVISVNKWTHVAATLGPSSATLYVNGVSVPATLSGSYTSIKVSNSPLKIGVYRNTGGSYANYFPGVIDDVRVYNRTLSAAEILQLYKLGSSVKR